MEFSGQISEKIQTKVIKKRQRQVGYTLFTIGILIFICMIVFNFFEVIVFDKIMLMWNILLCLLAILIAESPIKKNALRFKWNFTIRIDEKNIYKLHQGVEIEKAIPLTKIKRVIDAGEFYYIVFSDINNSYICQKDLLINGTIAEFEYYFKDKLKKRKMAKDDVLRF